MGDGLYSGPAAQYIDVWGDLNGWGETQISGWLAVLK
jgi:hypothetical protein